MTEYEVTAYYDNLRVTRRGTNSPTLDCACGESFSDDTWAGAGLQMDEHLEDHETGQAGNP